VRLSTTLSRRYYFNRLWKITWVCMFGGRIVKHYERRDGVGKQWKYVRGSVQEAQ
jgi:hypothetical protein